MRIYNSVIASVVVLCAAAFLLGTPSAALAQNDPSVGTWKLNPAKSKYDPGPVPKSNTITITSAGQGVKVSAKGVDAAGKPTSAEYTVMYDGKDAPVTGQPAYDAVSVKRVDNNTTELTRKKGGKVVQTARRTVSADGRMMTLTTTGTDEKGRKINNVAVFDRQ